MDENTIKRQEHNYFYVYGILNLFVKLFYPAKYIGRENIPNGPVIICANHSNYIDPLLICVGFGRKHLIHYMAKKELRSVPIIGPVLAAIGCCFVDRSSSGDVGAIRGMMQYLKLGCKVAVFPEGTRVSEDNAVAAKTGAVRLACRLGVPLLPIYIPRRKRILSRMRVVIGEPYTITGHSHAEYEQQSAELMERIAELGRREAA